MADLVAGLIGFLVILAGLVVITLMIRDKRNRDDAIRQRSNRRLQDLNAFIDKINQAETEDDLDNLKEWNGELCGNS